MSESRITTDFTDYADFFIPPIMVIQEETQPVIGGAPTTSSSAVTRRRGHRFGRSPPTEAEAMNLLPFY
jgi:hypothetical protein